MSVRRVPGPSAATLSVALKALDGLVGKTGYFETAKYADGTSVAYVAAIHEFGYPEGGIPQRATMLPTADEKGKPGGPWAKVAATGAKAALNGQTTAAAALEALTLVAAGDIGKAITALTSPPLDPRTIAAKGFSKPLVETGLMLQSVTGVVERKTS